MPYAAQRPAYLVEIPSDFNALKRESLALAQAWRRESGRVFSELFGRGYAVYEFLSEAERAVYLLRA